VIVIKHQGQHVYTAHVGGRYAGRARVNDAANHVDMLFVKPAYRRLGVAETLCAFIREHRGRFLTVSPEGGKTKAVRALERKAASRMSSR
jgi:GNAT superfamily N-acetyltransferase